MEQNDNGSSETQEMPLYQCRKQVWALKIKVSQILDDGTMIFYPEEEGYSPIRLSREYVEKHQPEIGGYYVRYQDGYESFSPPEAFEEGYLPVINVTESNFTGEHYD